MVINMWMETVKSKSTFRVGQNFYDTTTKTWRGVFLFGFIPVCVWCTKVVYQ